MGWSNLDDCCWVKVDTSDGVLGIRAGDTLDEEGLVNRAKVGGLRNIF